MSCKKLELFTRSSQVFVGVRAAHLFRFLCLCRFVFVICVVCIRPVSYVPNVACDSGLSIYECHSLFSRICVHLDTN